MTSAIDGVWEMVRGELDGEAAPELVARKTVVEITEDAYVVLFDGVVADRGVLEADSMPGMHAVVLRGIEGHNAGRTIPCIYQRVGDRLRVCYGLGGVPPTEFATAPGQARYLVTYRLRPDTLRP